MSCQNLYFWGPVYLLNLNLKDYRLGVFKFKNLIIYSKVLELLSKIQTKWTVCASSPLSVLLTLSECPLPSKFFLLNPAHSLRSTHTACQVQDRGVGRWIHLLEVNKYITSFLASSLTSLSHNFLKGKKKMLKKMTPKVMLTI